MDAVATKKGGFTEPPEIRSAPSPADRRLPQENRIKFIYLCCSIGCIFVCGAGERRGVPCYSCTLATSKVRDPNGYSEGGCILGKIFFNKVKRVLSDPYPF